MEEQLVQAVEIASNPAIATSQGQQDLPAQAIAYLDQLKANSQETWLPAWNVFSSRSDDGSTPRYGHNQRLFSLNIIDDFLENKVTQANDPAGAVAFLSEAALKHVNDEYVAGTGEQGTAFLRNKFSQTLTNMLLQSYGLPPPFTLLSNLLACMRVHASSSASDASLNPCSTDLILRLLHDVSIELGSDITLRVIRSRERLARDAAIRDEIRQSQAGHIADALWKVVQEGMHKIQEGQSTSAQSAQSWTQRRALEITAAATKVIGDYVSWIDISLIVTPETVPILFTLLQHSDSSLRIAAAETLLEVISKGMKSGDKVELLRVLNLTATIGELERSTRLAKGEETQEDTDVEFRERLAKLANGVAHELSRVVDDTTADDATRAAADDMLILHMSLVLELLSDRYDELAEAVLPSVTTVLVIYKKLKRRANTGQGTNNAIFTNDKALFLSRLLDIVIAKMRFDDSTEWSGGGQQSANSDEDDSEDEDIAKFLQLRKALQTVAASIAQMDMDLFAAKVQALIIDVLNATDASLAGNASAIPWQTVEHALFCTYFFGEVLANAQTSVKTGMNATSFVHLPQDMPKTQKSKVSAINFVDLTLNPLGETVQRFYRSSVSAYRHSAVQIQYFECAVRYAAFFTARPDAIGPVLQPFLDWRGIHHERPVVRYRVQYLFSRFVRETRECITADYVVGILEAIQDVLIIEAHMPPAKPDEDPLLNAVNSPSPFDSQLNLFETCGVLLSLLNTRPDQQATLLKAIVDPSLQKMKQAVEIWASNKEKLELVLETHHLFLALSNLAKGFPDQSSANAGRQAPPWMLVFKDVTEQILTSLAALNSFQVIRDAARGAFARIVATAGLVVLPYVPNLLNSLLGEVSSPELCDFLSFLGLIATKYKTDVAPVFEELFGPLITRTFSFLNREVAGTDDAVERNELIRSYVAFISQLCANGLEGVIRSERNPNQLQVILQSLVFYANNGDVGVQRQTLNVLVRLVNLWGGSSTPNGSTASNNQAPSIDLPGFEQFIYETLVGLIFEIPSKPTFDFKDAQTQIALTELCTLAKTIYQKRGNELLEYLTNVYLPRMQCPADMAQEFAQNLKRLEAKELRKALEAFILRSRGQT